MRIVQGVSTPDRVRHIQSTWRWFDREFEFDFPVAKLGEILARLRGTPCRVEELLRDTPAEGLKRRQGESWSIQENVGHLADLEPLWAARVEEVGEVPGPTNRHRHEEAPRSLSTAGL